MQSEQLRMRGNQKGKTKANENTNTNTEPMAMTVVVSPRKHLRKRRLRDILDTASDSECVNVAATKSRKLYNGTVKWSNGSGHNTHSPHSTQNTYNASHNGTLHNLQLWYSNLSSADDNKDRDKDDDVCMKDRHTGNEKQNENENGNGNGNNGEFQSSFGFEWHCNTGSQTSSLSSSRDSIGPIQTMSIFVKTLKGYNCTLRIPLVSLQHVNVEQLKMMVAAQTRVRACDQIIVYNGKTLRNHKLLSDYFIHDGATVHLLLRLK